MWFRLFIRIVLLLCASDISDDDTGVSERVDNATSGVDVPAEDVWGCDDKSTRVLLVEASAFVRFKFGVISASVSNESNNVLFSSQSTSLEDRSTDLLKGIYKN